MKSAPMPRALSLSSLFLASGALALSTWTACQEHAPTAVAEVSAVQERAQAPQGGPAQDVVGDARGDEAAVAARPAAEPEPSEASAARSARGTSTPSSRSSDAAAPSAAAAVVTPPEVKRLVLATAVENREPVALAGEAQPGEALTAFVELANPGSAPAHLVVTFEHSSGQKVGFVKLEVPGSSARYRTWARTQNIRQGGAWEAVVHLEDGTELARQSFTAAAPTTSNAPAAASANATPPAASPAQSQAAPAAIPEAAPAAIPEAPAAS